MRTSLSAVLVASALIVACAPAAAPPVTAPDQPAATTAATSQPAVAATTVTPADESVDAVLWVQTSVEYRATALQAYAAARRQLDAALGDTAWTAAVEQQGKPLAGLPPAIVLDADETVLDNSAFQARLIQDQAAYNEENWSAWVAERKAQAVPGAVAFTRYAAERGVAVFYVTNRDARDEAATRDNLAALGFPLDADRDTVFTRGERPEWKASDKSARREEVARGHRILLLVGDDYGDFLPAPRGTVAQRADRAAPYDAWWGTKWIVLPNPMYGSWALALTNEAGSQKRHQLRVSR